MKRLALLLLLVMSAVQALPPMPPSPLPVDAALNAANRFKSDVLWAQGLVKTLRPAPEFHAVDAPVVRPIEKWAYDVRRYRVAYEFQVMRRRESESSVKMSCDGSFPLLRDPSRVSRGIVMLLRPSFGREGQALHAMVFQPDGRVVPRPGLPGTAVAGVVRFADHERIWDVEVPYNGAEPTVREVDPVDRSF